MHRGYIKLWRKISDNALWTNEPFSRGQAWVDLVGLANHNDGFIRIRGMKVKIKRGQVGWSERRLGERWSWSRGKVRRFINELKTVQQIEHQKNNVTSTITIINYDLYQGDGPQNGTTDGPQTDHRQYPNKNGKKEKKEKKRIQPPPQASISILDDATTLQEFRQEFPEVHITEEIRKMQDYVLAHGRTYKDYKAFARNWLRKASTDERRRVR